MKGMITPLPRSPTESGRFIIRRRVLRSIHRASVLGFKTRTIIKRLNPRTRDARQLGDLVGRLDA